MDAIIHVGMHKAASTYLQKLFKSNRPLLSESGLLALTRHGHAERKARSNRLQPKRGAQAMLSRYLNEFEIEPPIDYGSALLSDEALEFLLSDPINFILMERKLRRMFDRFSYFVVVREQVGFQASMVQQWVKTFRIYDNQLPAVRTGKPRMFHPLNYLHRFRGLLNSNCRAIYMPMHELIEQGGAVVVQRLVETELGVAAPELVEAPASNSGIGSRGVAFSSFFRYCMLQSLQRSKLPVGITQAMKKCFLSHCRQHGWNQDRYFPFDADYVERLDHRLAGVNAKFARQAWNKSWQEVFPVQTHEQRVFDWQSLSEAQGKQLESVFADFMPVFYREAEKSAIAAREVRFEAALQGYLADVRRIRL